MEGPKDDWLSQDELLEHLTRGFGALLQKVEDLARENAEFEQQIKVIQAEVGFADFFGHLTPFLHEEKP